MSLRKHLRIRRRNNILFIFRIVSVVAMVGLLLSILAFANTGGLWQFVALAVSAAILVVCCAMIDRLVALNEYDQRPVR